MVTFEPLSNGKIPIASGATVGVFLQPGTYPEMLAELRAMQTERSNGYYYLSLEEGQQMVYTASHAAEFHFDLDELTDDQLEDEQARALSRRNALMSSDIEWSDLERALQVEGDPMEALERAIANPELLVDSGHYVQCYEEPGFLSWLADLPNGYFTCDLNPFQVAALCKRIEETTPFRFFGMGASYVGFHRLLAEPWGASDLVNDLAFVYGCTASESLAQTLDTSDFLFVGFTEDFPDRLLEVE